MALRRSRARGPRPRRVLRPRRWVPSVTPDVEAATGFQVAVQMGVMAAAGVGAGFVATGVLGAAPAVHLLAPFQAAITFLNEDSPPLPPERADEGLLMRRVYL